MLDLSSIVMGLEIEGTAFSQYIFIEQDWAWCVPPSHQCTIPPLLSLPTATLSKPSAILLGISANELPSVAAPCPILFYTTEYLRYTVIESSFRDKNPNFLQQHRRP